MNDRLISSVQKAHDAVSNGQLMTDFLVQKQGRHHRNVGQG